MSKMDKDSFGTYVTSKGFVFSGEGMDQEGVKLISYELGVDYFFKLNAPKSISLYLENNDNMRYLINYGTEDLKDHSNLKKQCRALGFKLRNSNSYIGDDGETEYNHLEYKKGKSQIDFYLDSKGKGFSISFGVSY
jgi:hypothetical protein